jgi:hypothetical protein
LNESNQYIDELRFIKSLLIVTSLQKREDLKAVRVIREFKTKLNWEPISDLMIDPIVWTYAVTSQKHDPKLVFCHPEILLRHPITSLYYRGLCGLSLKAVKDYFGSVESLEEGSSGVRFDNVKALKMARTYNTFICSIIKNSTDWTLENGNRTIIATLGITIDGRMRNKVGEIAEDRIRTLILEWLIDNHLIIEPSITKEQIYENVPRTYSLKESIIMEFSSEPDIAFKNSNNLLAIVEIKGGIDPAGALERYGAATKSFQHAIGLSSRCKNFYLGAVSTPELEKRIKEDRLVEKYFNIIDILNEPNIRDSFFKELFHHTLRLI